MSCLGNQGDFCLSPVRFAPVQLSCSSWISGIHLVRGFDFVLFMAFALEHFRLRLWTRVRDVHCPEEFTVSMSLKKSMLEFCNHYKFSVHSVVKVMNCSLLRYPEAIHRRLFSSSSLHE